MTKQDILDRINEIVIDEKGLKLSINGNFVDSDLDSLGVVIVIITLDDEFGILKGIPKGKEFDGIEELTVRDLVYKCKLRIPITSLVQNNVKDM